MLILSVHRFEYSRQKLEVSFLDVSRGRKYMSRFCGKGLLYEVSLQKCEAFHILGEGRRNEALYIRIMARRDYGFRVWGSRRID
jgi:hypothetical protein